ncbi:MAG: hypothetical protein QXE81_05875 [Desulfurococcaceae archaeon]
MERNLVIYVCSFSIVLSIILVMLFTVTPLLQGYGIGEEIKEAGVVIPVEYIVQYECPDGKDPFAGSFGFLLNTALARYVWGGWAEANQYNENFYSISSGIILSRRYIIEGDTIVQMLYFYFNSNTTTTLKIRSAIWFPNQYPNPYAYDALYIDYRNYEAHRVYRYTLTFPKISYTTVWGNITMGLGWPSNRMGDGTPVVRGYNSGVEVLLNPSFSFQYSKPTEGSTTWTVHFVISFNDANDIGKTFDTLSLFTIWDSSRVYEHVRIVFNEPFTIQDIGDRIVLAITFQLVPMG